MRREWEGWMHTWGGLYSCLSLCVLLQIFTMKFEKSKAKLGKKKDEKEEGSEKVKKEKSLMCLR